VKYGLLAVDDERVTGVMAALEPDDGLGALGKEIYDRALALIAPLGADDYDVPAQRSTPHDIQQGQARNHESEAEASQLAVFEISHDCESTAPALGRGKRQQAFDDQVESQARKKI
jgi:hypothetical protein